MAVVRAALLNRKSGKQAPTHAGHLVWAISSTCIDAFVKGLISETTLLDVSLKKTHPPTLESQLGQRAFPNVRSQLAKKMITNPHE